MNVRTFEARRNDAAKSAPATQPAPVRHLHRERDFGVGYGNSSGYEGADVHGGFLGSWGWLERL